MSDIRELQGQLRTAGLRATLPRVAVLQHLRGADSPLTHGEVADALADRGFDRATIYRNLIDLTEAGFISRTDLGDHVWRFELKHGDEAQGELHPHFICNDCGSVECLPDEAVMLRAVRGAPRALKKKGVQVQVRGICNDCG
jgi:Fur family transcriptional regulator, ferric uptake regulator